MVRIQNMRPLDIKFLPWEFFGKTVILSKNDKNNFLEKSVLKLCWTAMIKPRKIESSGFFSTGLQRTNLSLQIGLRSSKCSQKIGVPKKLGSQKIFGPKNFRSKKSGPENKFWSLKSYLESVNFWTENVFLVEYILGQKKIWVQKISDLKDVCVWKNFGLEKMRQKNFDSESKKMWAPFWHFPDTPSRHPLFNL